MLLSGRADLRKGGKLKLPFPVILELDRIAPALCCRSPAEVVEYLLVYWASEGELEEKYDLYQLGGLEDERELILNERWF